MRTKSKEACQDSRDILLAALANAEEDVATARAERDAMARSKDVWMGECNQLHARLDAISKLAGKGLTADG